MQLESRLRVRYGQFTSAGAKPGNEDCLGVCVPEGDGLAAKGVALVIADGVSAVESGREAAELCVQGFLADYYSTPDTWEVRTATHGVLASLNRWLWSAGSGFAGGRRGLVSTVGVLILSGQTAHVFHVGDTRVYRWRGGELARLTEDHTAWGAGGRRQLVRAVGLEADLDLDYRHEEVREDDLYLLTTDGIHDHVDERGMEQLLLEEPEDLDAVCDRLAALALENGSKDNLSAQLVRVESLPSPSRREFFESLCRLPFPPELTPGRRLDGYEVLEVLDPTPTGGLYRVRDTDDDAEWWLRTPSRDRKGDARYVERFVREEWTGRRISSSHLVEVVEKKRSPNQLYYLMRPVRGETLAEWMKAHPRASEAEVVSVVGQVIRGLRALHRRDVLHLGLSPGIIVIEPACNVRIARLGTDWIRGGDRLPLSVPRALAVCQSPEVRLGHRPSFRSDLFSLGILAYAMLTGGLHPYGDQYASARTVKDFTRLEYVPAGRTNPGLGAWLDGCLRKAVALDPARRHDSLEDFLTDLRQPNADYLEPSEMPLLERNPELFWKWLAAGFCVLWLLTLLAR